MWNTIKLDYPIRIQVKIIGRWKKRKCKDFIIQGIIREKNQRFRNLKRRIKKGLKNIVY